MAGLRDGTRLLSDLPEKDEQPLNQYDAYARSITKPGNVNPANPAHAKFIDEVKNAVESGLISEAGIRNVAKYNPSLAPMLYTSYNNYKIGATQKRDTKQLIGQYLTEGQPAIPDRPYTEQDVGTGIGPYQLASPIQGTGTPAVPAKQDYAGLVNALAGRGQVELAEKYQKLGGLDKKIGRGEYYVPIQTAKGIYSFNARTGEVTDSGGNIVGSASDPELQARITGAKEHAEKIGAEVADVGRSVDASTSIDDAKKMLDKGIYSGSYAEISKTIAKAIPGMDKTKAANTEEFISHIGNVVIPRLKEFGGNDTVEEMLYLKMVQGGEIKMEPEALRRILVTADRKIKAKQERLKRQARTVGLGGKVNEAIKEETVTPYKSFKDDEYDAMRKRILGR